MADQKDSTTAPPAPPSYDWGPMTARRVDNLRAPKIPDVPARIVELAQESYDGKPVYAEDGKTPLVDEAGNPILGHVMEYDFGPDNVEMAREFAKHMKNAGLHTQPLSSVSVAPDPENDGREHVVRWKAGERKGRKATSA